MCVCVCVLDRGGEEWLSCCRLICNYLVMIYFISLFQTENKIMVIQDKKLQGNLETKIRNNAREISSLQKARLKLFASKIRLILKYFATSLNISFCLIKVRGDHFLLAASVVRAAAERRLSVDGRG